MATRKPVVVSSETNTGTLVTANPDGSFTLTETSEPVRVKQHGTWVPINPDLVRGAHGTWDTVATTSGVMFSGGGTAPMATLLSGGDSLSFTFPRTLPKPSVSGPVATYRNVLPGVNLQLTANASGFSELLIVRDKAAAANPALRTLHLGTSARGVTVAGTPDGGAQATTASGARVFHTDTASMWDSSPSEPANTSTAKNTVGIAQNTMGTASTGMGHMAKVGIRVSRGSETLVPDGSLLSSAKTVFPVYIDPAWSGNPSQLDWARISSNGWNIYNSTSTASSDHPRSGYDDWSGGADEVARTFYQMDTSGIASTHVASASLYITDNWSAYSSPTNMNLYDTGEPTGNGWNSTDLNWSNQPGAVTLQDGSETSYETSGGTVSPGTIQFNILNGATASAGNGGGRLTLVLKSGSETDRNYWKQYASGGGATISVTYYVTPDLVGGTGHPTLTPPVVSGADPGFITSQTPTLKISCEANSAVANNVEQVENFYQVYHYSGGTETTQVGSDLTSGTFSTNGDQVTTGTLAEGTYAWRARCKNRGPGPNSDAADSLGTNQYWDSNSWSAWQVFTVDTSKPPTPTVSSPQFPAGMMGGAYDDPGTFTFNNDHSDTIGGVKGYMYSLDGDLSGTAFSGIPPQLSGTAIASGKTYWAPASTDPNGYATVSFAPGTSGPHRLFVLAVDQAGNVSATENTYEFWAGFTTPTILNADQLYGGYTAADGTAVPAATYNATGGGAGQLWEQPDCCNLHWYNGKQIAMENGSGTVNQGDGMTVSFDVPADGYYDLGADLTKAGNYGIFNITLDASSATPVTLFTGFDGYASPVTTQFLDLGVPPDPSTTGGSLLLKTGIHTLTFATTGQNASSTGYLLGFDALRIAPMAPTCDITSISNCYDNTAITAKADIDNFGTTLPNTAPADGADGAGDTYPAEQLSNAGWTPGASITADGAPMTLPAYGTGLPDNIVSGGQTIELVDGGNPLAPNTGNAVVFLASATEGPVTGASGTITYTGSCYNGTTQTFTLSTVPDWATGPASTASISLPDRNTRTTWEKSGIASQIYAISVPLKCANVPVASIQLPEVSNGVKTTEAALHIFALGVRPSSFTSSAGTQYWADSYAAAEDSHDGSLPQTTVRIPATVSLGGTSLRIHLSNALGTAPVTFNHVTVATQSAAAQPVSSSMTDVTFGSSASASVTIPAGGDATSDPIGLATNDKQTLLVSIWTSAAIPDTVGHADAGTPTWTASGTTTDQADDTTGTPFTATSDNFTYWLTGIDVTSNGNTDGTVGFYGDQTINSDSSSGAPNRFTDDVTSDIASSNGGPVPYGVVDLGSGTTAGNLIPVLSSAAQTSAANPVDRNILQTTNIRTVLISTGTTDILNGETAATVKNNLTALVKEIQSYYADNITNNQAGLITVYVATIPPSSQFNQAEETVREQVNQAICGTSGTNGGCDTTGNTGADLNGAANGFVDFAGAVSGGNDLTLTVAPDNLSGNGDPNDAYYAAEATAYNNAAVAVTTGATSSPSGVLNVQPDALPRP